MPGPVYTYVEQKSNREPQFVKVKRSHSHHHHHHHRPHRDERADITRAQLSELMERERGLATANAALLTENASLKDHLSRVTQALNQSQAAVAQLQHENRSLAAQNGALRRSLDSSSDSSSRHEREKRQLRHEITRLRNRIGELEKDNGSLKARIRELTREVTAAIDDRVNRLVDEVTDLRRKLYGARDQYRAVQGKVDALTAENVELLRENEQLRVDLIYYRRRMPPSPRFPR